MSWRFSATFDNGEYVHVPFSGCRNGRVRVEDITIMPYNQGLEYTETVNPSSVQTARQKSAPVYKEVVAIVA